MALFITAGKSRSPVSIAQLFSFIEARKDAEATETQRHLRMPVKDLQAGCQIQKKTGIYKRELE